MLGNGSRPRTHLSGGEIATYPGGETQVMAAVLGLPKLQNRERGMLGVDGGGASRSGMHHTCCPFGQDDYLFEPPHLW